MRRLRLYAVKLDNFTYLTDLAGSVLRAQGVDNGTTVSLNDAAGHPLSRSAISAPQTTVQKTEARR